MVALAAVGDSHSPEPLEFKHPRCPRCKTTELLYEGELPGQRSTKPFTRLPIGTDDDKQPLPEALQDDDEALDAQGDACPSAALIAASTAEPLAAQPLIAHPPP